VFNGGKLHVKYAETIPVASADMENGYSPTQTCSCPQNVHNIATWWQFKWPWRYVVSHTGYSRLAKQVAAGEDLYLGLHPHMAEFLCLFPNVKSVHAIPIFDFDACTLLHRDVRKSPKKFSMKCVRNPGCAG